MTHQIKPEKKFVKRIEVNLEDYDGKNWKDVVTQLDELLNKQLGHGKTAEFHYQLDYGRCYSCGIAAIDCYFDIVRNETDEEFEARKQEAKNIEAARKQRAKEQKKAKEEQERKELERLKKKYENK